MIESGNLWDFYVGTQQLATHDGCEDPLAALRDVGGGTLGLATYLSIGPVGYCSELVELGWYLPP